MTWKEFKQTLERQGVRDDDEIEWIETGPNSKQVIVVFNHSIKGQPRRFFVVEK